jgi:prolyl oligopeptidase
MLRAEFTANGPPNIPEFGTVKNEAEFDALREMSTYEHIIPGTAYPALLFYHGYNDPRVDVWMSAKAAARFQAATTSRKPVLLDIDYGRGHGIGNTRAQHVLGRISGDKHFERNGVPCFRSQLCRSKYLYTWHFRIYLSVIKGYVR